MSDVMRGVHKPEALIARMRKMDRSYIKGSLQVLERKPPNPFIVPVLKKLLARI